MASVEKYVSYMEKTAKDDSHGYAQDNRNGDPDYDCSSLTGKALNYAGFKVSATSTTKNLAGQLEKCGFEKVSAPFKRGDIHLKVGKHVAVSTDANHIVHASINEKGKTTNGKKGDQTGKEICIRSYYEYKGGWDAHYRYVGSNSTTTPASTTASYKVGSVYTLQTELKVRSGPGTNYAAKTHNQLTSSAKKADKDGDGALEKGTRVTCKEVRNVNGAIWMRIPSGWCCAKTASGKVYIK